MEKRAPASPLNLFKDFSDFRKLRRADPVEAGEKVNVDEIVFRNWPTPTFGLVCVSRK
jgi:hypothetical protein